MTVPLRPLALLLPALALALPLPLPAADLTEPSLDWRVNLGLATPFRNLQANAVNPGAGQKAYDQRIDGAYQGSPHVGLQMMRGSVDQEGVGWMWALELAWDQHRGRADSINGLTGDFGSEGDMTLNAFSGTFMIGPLLQASMTDLGVRADAFRVELGPTVGLGSATATMGSSSSETGLLWSVGALMLLTTAFENDVTLTIGGGYEYSQAKVRWGNTGLSTATAFGVQARVGLGYRF